MPRRDVREALRRLEADGLLHRSGPRLRPTRRWQSAMARAALLLAGGEAVAGGEALHGAKGNARREIPEGAELRIAIVLALLEIYGPELEDEAIADLVEAILPIEAEELAPRAPDANSSVI